MYKYTTDLQGCEKSQTSSLPPPHFLFHLMLFRFHSHLLGQFISITPRALLKNTSIPYYSSIAVDKELGPERPHSSNAEI